MSKKNSLFRVLACFVLFPFLFAAAPEYDECEDLGSDVSLGLFALPQDSEDSPTIDKDSAASCFFSNFCSKTHPIRYHQSWNTDSQRFSSEVILSVTLRC
jgi:hypothetical protein